MRPPANRFPTPSSSLRDRERKNSRKRARRASEKTLLVLGSWNPRARITVSRARLATDRRRAIHYSLTQEGLCEPPVDGNDVPSRLRTLVAGQPHDGGRTVFGEAGLLRQRTLRIKIRELGAEFLSRFRVRESDLVFFKRLHHPIAREHARTCHHGRRRN